MYEKMIEDMKVQMKPVMDLAETNKKALEVLAGLQKDTMTELLNASLEQFKSLSECKDPKAALELNLSFYKALEAKLADTTGKSIAAMSEVKDAYVATVEKAAKKTASEVEEAVKKATSKIAA